MMTKKGKIIKPKAGELWSDGDMVFFIVEAGPELEGVFADQSH
jgi:hypothetical protein